MNTLNCFEYVTLAYPVLMDLPIQSPPTLSKPNLWSQAVFTTVGIRAALQLTAYHKQHLAPVCLPHHL